ncbi:anthrone oxygenase family protein [Mycolicibacter senuensis]|uniref:DUF1772 domain-containing protein n=1 Tax=Mycolicibacter senuensis TaxID=386913 RepID=A0A7I9XQH4_9MYCO|nr:anthrone oxygenase family protein [Mycolicibacter senuensis]ORW66779.1 hypothetical protein AWC24_12430 [Mycolicibacter senuensis]GFG72245.1 hypothetical protein MSEN_39650 [Mycolicibacter senuensis]
MMLGIVAVAVVGVLVGSEFAVAAFFHPIVGRLPDEAFQAARSASARLLGRVMPFWYLGSLALLVIAAALGAGTQRWLIGAGVALMTVVALMSVTMLVPINNRIAAGEVPRPLAERWDRLHRVRVVLLGAVLVLLVVASA